MTPQERQLIDDLFDRLSRLENSPRDPDAQAAIAEGLRKAPNAIYALVQTALVQDEALRRAHERIQELEGGAPSSASPAASSIRCANPSSGRTQRRAARCRMSARRAWATARSGTAAKSCSRRRGRAVGGYGQPYGAQQPPPRRRRWWRLVPWNGSGGCGRRGRRLAPARQHPLHDGRRRPPAELWRYRRPQRRCRGPQAVGERSARRRPRQGSRRQRHRLVARPRRRRQSRFASGHVRPGLERGDNEGHDDDDIDHDSDGFDDDGGGGDGDYA